MSSIRTQKLLSNSPQVLDEFIQEIKENPDSIFEIEVRGNYFSSSKPNQGIELLKWVRLKGIKNHIILRAGRSLSELLKGLPKNAIIASKGVTLLGMNEDIPDSGFEEADPDELRELFKLDFDLTKIRHDEANWFALRKLWEHHSLVSEEPIPTFPNDDLMLHAIIDFVSCQGSAKPTPGQIRSATQKLNRLQLLFCKTEAHRINGCMKQVIFVDDKAEGWKELLSSILGNNCNFTSFSPDSSSTADTVYDQILNEIDRRGGWIKFVQTHHVYISDLKLLDTERDKTDYTRLLSYKIIKKLRTPRDNRLRIMFFTASNDLSKIKGMLSDRLYNPQIIYTKEGADQGLSEAESFNKYIELLDSLYRILKGRAKESLNNIQIYNLAEEENKEKYVEEYLAFIHDFLKTDLYADQDFSSLANKTIYIDTNMFCEPKFAKYMIQLLLTKQRNIKILATVKHELSCISTNTEENRGYEEIHAAFFLKLINSLDLPIDYTKLDTDDKDLADEEFCKTGHHHHRSNFADDQFVSILNSVNTNCVLFCKDKLLINRLDSQTVLYSDFSSFF